VPFRRETWPQYSPPGKRTNDYISRFGSSDYGGYYCQPLADRRPQFDVGGWAIIINLLTYSGDYDIALRDFGCALEQ